MKRSFALSLCAVALTAFTMSNTRADDLKVDLEYSGGSWSLYAEVIDTAGGADGQFGISAVRALVDGIDFGTDGDAVTISNGIGAINPVQTSGGDRAPVLQLSGGTIDLLYGQDISDAGSVVTGVGVGSRALLATGSYSGSAPTAGTDGSLATDGLFLNAGSGPFGAAVDPDNVLFSVAEVGGVILGDVSLNGTVGFEDIQPFIDRVGTGTYQAEADINENGSVGFEDIQPFIDIVGGGGSLTASAVPEPTSVVLLATAAMCLVTGRRRS